MYLDNEFDNKLKINVNHDGVQYHSFRFLAIRCMYCNELESNDKLILCNLILYGDKNDFTFNILKIRTSLTTIEIRRSVNTLEMLGYINVASWGNIDIKASRIVNMGTVDAL